MYVSIIRECIRKNEMNVYDFTSHQILVHIDKREYRLP